jgi:SSS family solute:Na+ symporter
MIFFFLSCCNQRAELKNQAEDVLETVLNDGQAWEKVHAAEFLIKLGHSEKVLDVFLSESSKNGDVPEYRIGIWRVLYQCAKDEEKQIWQDHIYRAFIHPASPDRIHAVETLAKLKISEKNEDATVVESAIASIDRRLSFYTQWWIIPQRDHGIEKLKYHLFQIIQSDEKDSVRQLAAYVLCEDPAIRFNHREWQMMENIAISEPAKSGVRLQLLAAAFSKASVDSVQPASFQKIRKMLLEYSDSDKASLCQLCWLLARKGEMKDMDVLKPLLRHRENDVKIAAAYAICQIDRQINPTH